MRLLTFEQGGQARIGVWLEDWVVDLNRAQELLLQEEQESDERAVAAAHLPADMLSLLAGGKSTLDAARKTARLAQDVLAADPKAMQGQGIAHAAVKVTFLPPVPRPGKIVCVGLNYPAPGQGGGTPAPEYPVLFHKVTTTLTGHGQPVVIPRLSQEVVYEGELAVVIGKKGKHIGPEEALEYVAGYAIANDVGASDLERRTVQWATGKLPDTFCPLGPALVTRDEVPDPGALAIQTTLNGELVQSGNTGEMIFDVPYLVSYISALATLEPGDLILTGSPKRLGDLPAPRRLLGAGDRVSIRIDKLGELSNPVEVEF